MCRRVGWSPGFRVLFPRSERWSCCQDRRNRFGQRLRSTKHRDSLQVVHASIPCQWARPRRLPLHFYQSRIVPDRPVAETRRGDTFRALPDDLIFRNPARDTCDKQSMHDAGVADYTQVIRLDPDHVKAYNNRGNAYAKQGNKAKAEADFAKADSLR